MTTTVSKVSPQTAPRDPQALMKMGIFQLRLLIEACGGLANPDEKMAFAKMSVEEKVQLALQLLAQWDRVNGGAPAQMPMNGAGHAAPMQMMPPPQGMPVMQVDPAQVAAAAQAAAPPPVRRSPSNKAAQTAGATAPAGTDLGSDVLNALNRIIQQNDEQGTAFGAAMKDLLGQVVQANKENAENASNYKAVYGALGVMNTALANVQFQTKLAMALVLPLAEQVLGASREQILQAATGDVEIVGQILAQAAASGKG